MGPSIHKPIVVVVGGFLGAGKTTLLLAAAKELGRQGIRSAIILNDQGESLVDSEFAELQGSIHAEVTGGCFCCASPISRPSCDDCLPFLHMSSSLSQ
jgi:G3E family GTPase